MPKVAVIGAGIAGLAAAHQLRQMGIEPVVLEAGSRAGGVIASELIDGFLVERGPNSIQSHSPLISDLIDQLGIQDRVVRASEGARNRFIVRDGRPVAAPLSPLQLAGSELFGARAKLRLLREPFVAPGNPAIEESVADFIRRRLGGEFLDYGMNPFVGGVYAGDPERLSIRYAFPSLFRMEQESGSIIRGQIDRQRDASSATDTHRMFSFRGGLQELPLAMAASLGDAIRYDSPVQEVRPSNGSWTILTDRSDHFDAIIAAVPLYRLATLIGHFVSELSPFRDVSYPPLSVVALGYRKTAIRHPLDGFGMLIPEVERSFQILGTLFTSSIFPGRAPEGHVLLTSFVGGARRPELAGKSSDQLFDVVHADLSRLLGISDRPTFRHHVFWEHAIPQYTIGYGSVLRAADQLEEENPGVFVAGNFRNGISVGETAQSGHDAAVRCSTFLARGKNGTTLPDFSAV